MFGKKGGKEPEKKAQRKGQAAPPPRAPEQRGAPAQRPPPTEAAVPPGRRLTDPMPIVLGAAAVVWLETCLGRMPSVAKLQAGLKANGFQPEPEAVARAVARGLALDAKIVATPLRDLRHSCWRKEHKGVPAVILLSTAQSDLGEIVFCSALFGGATEAEAVRAVENLTNSAPLVGGLAHDADGKVVRRVFWKVSGGSGVKAIAVSGPEDPATRDHLRALIAFNRAM